MKRNAKTIVAGIVALAMSHAAMAKDIKVAVVGAMSGPVAQWGDMEFNGARQAIKDINASGGIKGDKLVAVEYDDACDPKQAVAVANKIVNDGIQYVIGHLCSSSTQPASDIYEDEGILMISPGATNPELTQRGYQYIMRTAGLDSSQGPTAAKYIVEKVKPQRIAIIHDKQQYGEGLARSVQDGLKKANIGAKIVDVKPTEVPNLYWVSLDGMPSVYATADGKYILQGEIVRLGGKELYNVSQSLQAASNKKIFEQLKAEDLLIYKAQGKTKHVVYVFTDVSCPYCHKLHEHMDEITGKGVEVRYIAWPRGEQHIPMMEAIWCSADRKAAFSKGIAGEQIAPASCSSPVRSMYEMGLNIGVNGTPAIYSTDGVYLGGYMEPNELAERLNK